MPLWRTQNNVPNVYTDFSRDFQVLERAYDVVYNGVMFDVDGVRRLTDTKLCNTNALALLQTKLGFFSNATFTDEELRYILSAFPTIVHNKGSMLGIRQAIYMYLKTQHLRTDALITVTNTPERSSQRPYTVSIGIQSDVKSITVLEEVLKYVLPAGYMTNFYFYNNAYEVLNTELEDYATVILISNNINSTVFSSGDWTLHTDESGSYYTYNLGGHSSGDDDLGQISSEGIRLVKVASTTSVYSDTELTPTDKHILKEFKS